MNPSMEYSKIGLELTESFEGCKLEAYKDQGGVWTIGYGHTGPEVYYGLRWTQAQCESALLNDIRKAERHVNQIVNVQLTQDEFDALVDFAFNCGCKALDSSTLLRLVNAGDFEHAPKEFEKWDHVGGVVVAGLLRRRLAEEQEFES